MTDWGRRDWATAGWDQTTLWYALRCADAYKGGTPVAKEVVASLREQGWVDGHGHLTRAGETMLADLGGPFPAALRVAR